MQKAGQPIYALFIAGILLWTCSGNVSQNNESNESIASVDSAQINTTTDKTEIANQNIEAVKVGSDELVDRATLDTLYYTILKYQPVPGDFYSLSHITDNAVELGEPNGNPVFIVHLITSEHIITEDDRTKDFMGNTNEIRLYKLHNYFYVVESGVQSVNILSTYYLGDCSEIQYDVGATEEGNYYNVSLLAIQEGKFGISVQQIREVYDGIPTGGLAAIYVLADGTLKPILEYNIPVMSNYSGEPRIDQILFHDTQFLGLNLLTTSSNGFFDIGIEEKGENYVYETREGTTVKPCRWNGEQYVCN